MSADRPPGAPPLSVSAGACPLWLRLQNLFGRDGAMVDAAEVAHAMSPGEVVLHPREIAGGEIGYAVWNRPCR